MRRERREEVKSVQEGETFMEGYGAIRSHFTFSMPATIPKSSGGKESSESSTSRAALEEKKKRVTSMGTLHTQDKLEASCRYPELQNTSSYVMESCCCSDQTHRPSGSNVVLLQSADQVRQPWSGAAILVLRRHQKPTASCCQSLVILPVHSAAHHFLYLCDNACSPSPGKL